MSSPLHPKTNRAPRDVLTCIEPLEKLRQEIMPPKSERWFHCHSLGEYNASLAARKKYCMSDRMVLVAYFLGLLLASTL